MEILSSASVDSFSSTTHARRRLPASIWRCCHVRFVCSPPVC
ncbi:hypothetical protein Lser_V15G24925 [Lactuca serriola]